MSLTVGVNLGVDFNGGSKVEIQLKDDANVSSYESKINSVLEDYGYVIDSSATEDKYTNSYFVFKINNKDIPIEHKQEIREKLANKLEIELDQVGEFLTISGNITQKNLISISIAVACVLLVFMFIGWARYGIMEGLSLMVVGLHNMIISFAIILTTTLQINIPTVVAILVCSLVALCVYAFILERARETKNSSLSKDMSDFEIFEKANKNSLTNIVIFSIAIAVLAVACAFSQMHYIRLFAISLVLCGLVAVYSTNAIGSLLGATLANIKTTADKQSLSKNVESKPEQKKTGSKVKKSKSTK